MLSYSRPVHRRLLYRTLTAIQLQEESGHEWTNGSFTTVYHCVQLYLVYRFGYIVCIPSLAGHCVSSSSKTPKWPRRWPLPVRTAGQQIRRLLCCRLMIWWSVVGGRWSVGEYRISHVLKKGRRRPVDAVGRTGGRQSVNRQFKSRQHKERKRERESSQKTYTQWIVNKALYGLVMLQKKLVALVLRQQ